MGKLNLTQTQRGKMMGIWPQLGKKKEELTNKGMSEEKVTKQVNIFFEGLFIKLLTEEVFHVKQGEWHQLINNSKDPCHIIEIQYGESTNEDDIERLFYYDKN